MHAMSRHQMRSLLSQIYVKSLRLISSGTSRPCQRFSSTAPRRLAPPTATALKNETADNFKLGALGRTASGKKLNIRTYPRFDDLDDERLYRKQHLAAAFRVFAERALVRGLLDISVRTFSFEKIRGGTELITNFIGIRDPILTDRFCKSQSPYSTFLRDTHSQNSQG